jgi:uncharacterized membrane protein
MVFGWFWMLAFWGFIAWLVVWAVRRLSGERPAPRGESALEVLRRRLAAGEITPEQFDELRRRMED